jgi:hypothetical protein
MHRHLENEHLFSKLLSWKITILDVIIITIGFGHQNAREYPLGANYLRCTKILSQCHIFLFFYLVFFPHVKTCLRMIMMEFRIVIV